MQRLAKIVTFLAVIAIFLNTLNTARAQSGAATLVLSPPTIVFTPAQYFTGQGFAITASDNSSIAPGITVTDPGLCTQSLQVSSEPNQGPAILAEVFLFQTQAPYGNLVCHVMVTDPRLGTAELLVTLVNGEATGPNGQFAVSDASLSFTPGNPTSRGLCLFNLGASTPVSYTATATVTSGPDWLQVTPASGMVPSGTFGCGNAIQVQATRGALAPGKYSGTVTITPTNLGDAPPLVVGVSFTVAGDTPLQVARESVPVGTGIVSVSFNYEMGRSAPPPQTLSILSRGVRPIAFSATLYPGSPWLTIEPNGTRMSTPAGITLKLTPAALTLPAGYYGATINVSAPEASNPDCAIFVTLYITQGPQLILGIEPTAFNFPIGGPNPPSQTIAVTTTGEPISFSGLAQVTTQQPWLQASPPAGTASATAPQALTITVNPAGLDPGAYMGSIDASNTVVTGGNATSTFNNDIPVTLNVSNSPLLNWTPSTLIFSFQTPQGPPAPQTINLSSTTSSLPFTAAALAVCGTERINPREARRFERHPWFMVSPNHGVTQGTTNVPITISVNPAVVTSEQTCTGLVTITSAGAANTIQIPVTLNALTGQ